MNVCIKIIPNDAHRSPIGGGRITGADWYFDEAGDLQVRVSKMSDPRYEMALALHETFEAILCRFQGVSVESVDRFDVIYESTHDVKCSAGDSPDAPYAKQHNFAEAAERIFAGAAGIQWETYNKELETL